MRYAIAVTALLLYTVAISGMAIGAQTAYTADSPAEATVMFNGTHFGAGGNVTAVEVKPNASNDGRPGAKAIDNVVPDFETPLDPYIRSGVRGFVEYTMKGGFHVAAFTGSVSAAVFYRLQFLPVWLVSGFIELLGVAPFLGVGAFVLSRTLDISGWLR